MRENHTQPEKNSIQDSTPRNQVKGRCDQQYSR